MPAYRANPAYELVPYDSLPAPARELLRELKAEPSFYGVLRPRDGASLPMLAVDREAAELFLRLLDEDDVPGDLAHLVPRLLFDGALQIRKDGVFVSGAAAIEARRHAGRDRIGRLSLGALQYAHRLPLAASEIASRLNAFNTVPIGRRARARAFAAHGAWRTSSDAEWQTWSRGELTEEDVTHELHVSPRPEDLGDCVEALTGTATARFRVATTPRGQHRPDKLVASFSSLDALKTAAAHLESTLRGVAPQGVPFTAQLGGDGLLSWTTPRWRRWLLHRLARAVVASRESGATYEHALERIALDGIDVERWVPGTERKA